MINNLINKRFGRLVVINYNNEISNEKGRPYWLCKCDCGNYKTICAKSLVGGITQSCGCYNKEKVKEANKIRRHYNKYDLSKYYGIGWTSNTNKEFYFDLEDYELIKEYYWFENQNGYIASSFDHKYIILHRLITNIDDKNVQVDHFNRNKKDNRKENLRIVNPQYNNYNKGLQTNNQSGVTGVTWNKKSQKWVVYIMRKYLGCFNNFEDAVRVRKEAEEKYFGEWSYNNRITKYY